MKFATIRQRCFDFAAAISLFVFLLLGGLWARSLGHFEMVRYNYVHWLDADRFHQDYASLAWYSNTLRIEMRTHSEASGSSKTTVRQLPPGTRLSFIAESVTQEMNGYPPGFYAQRGYHRLLFAKQEYFILSVRPWLPTLLAAILPALWFIQHRRRSGAGWRFGLREMFIVTTVLALLLGGALWLMI